MRDIMLYSEKQFKSQSLQERTAYTKNVLKLLGETMNMDQRPQKQSGYKIDNIKALANGSHKDKEQYYDFVYDTEIKLCGTKRFKKTFWTRCILQCLLKTA